MIIKLKKIPNMYNKWWQITHTKCSSILLYGTQSKCQTKNPVSVYRIRIVIFRVASIIQRKVSLACPQPNIYLELEEYQYVCLTWLAEAHHWILPMCVMYTNLSYWSLCPQCWTVKNLYWLHYILFVCIEGNGVEDQEVVVEV